jgi:release factor glutamine methyltransferase
MNVYTPGEDSHLLRDFISELDLQNKKALDMGTGSGIIAFKMSEKGAAVTAADINPEALKEAEMEAEEADVELVMVETDLFEEIDSKYDIITFNPPYLPGEKRVGDEEIWRGGETGVEIVESFLNEVDLYLADGGEAYVILSSRAEYEKTVEKFDLEIVDSEKLWFEKLFVAKYK